MFRAFRLAAVAVSLATAVGTAASAVPASAAPPAAPARGAAAAAGGTQLWLAKYRGAGASNSRAAAMAVSPDGSHVFVTGTVEYPSAAQAPYFATLAYDTTTGKWLWGARYLGHAGPLLQASAIAVSPDGSTVFVTGVTPSPGVPSVEATATLAYNAATGARLWVRTHGPVQARAGTQPNALAVSPDGSEVFVTAMAPGAAGGSVLSTVAYKAATGTTVWVRRVSDGGVSAGGPSVVVSHDGSQVYVAGSGTGTKAATIVATTADYATATGVRRWVARNRGQGEPDPCYLAVSRDGTRVFLGTTTDPRTNGGAAVYHTLAYNAATGARQWSQTFAVLRHASVLSAIAVSPDGSAVFVTGEAGHTGSPRIGTIAYNSATGAQLWNEEYPLTDAGIGISLSVSPDGSQVFAAGQAGNTSTGFATVDYDTSTGATLWSQTYNGPAGGIASAVVASPTGTSVFVTGTSTENVGPSQFAPVYATLAYAVSG